MHQTRHPRVGRSGIEHRRRPACPPRGAAARRGRVAGRRAGGAGRTAFRAGLLAAALGAGLPTAQPRAQEGPRLDEVIDRAADYVAEYVDELSNVVMEEEYRQTYYRNRSATAAHSRLVSEFLLMRVDEEGQWVGFRDVVELNGRVLENRGNRLSSLFAEGRASALAQARRISEESARYNLGETGRTFNVPTYSLFFLHPANVDRFDFERTRTGRAGCAGEETAWDVSFQEIAYPTIARGYQGISLPASGRFCLDPASGRVLETEFELHHPPAGRDRPATDATARVTFGLEPRLGIWVPLEMRDSVSEDGGRRTANIARYRNYRQFDIVVSENSDPPPDESGSPR